MPSLGEAPEEQIVIAVEKGRIVAVPVLVGVGHMRHEPLPREVLVGHDTCAHREGPLVGCDKAGALRVDAVPEADEAGPGAVHHRPELFEDTDAGALHHLGGVLLELDVRQLVDDVVPCTGPGEETRGLGVGLSPSGDVLRQRELPPPWGQGQDDDGGLVPAGFAGTAGVVAGREDGGRQDTALAAHVLIGVALRPLLVRPHDATQVVGMQEVPRDLLVEIRADAPLAGRAAPGFARVAPEKGGEDPLLPLLLLLLLRLEVDLYVLLDLRGAEDVDLDLHVAEAHDGRGRCLHAPRDAPHGALLHSLQLLVHQLPLGFDLLAFRVAEDVAGGDRHAVLPVDLVDLVQRDALVEGEAAVHHRDLVRNDVHQRQLLEAPTAQGVHPSAVELPNAIAMLVAEAIVRQSILLLVLVVASVDVDVVRELEF
mmetsp:Transcript_56238/g.162932  ORF Transcript_56238/g.162932 Transcript_56238/m.162932 type:complete len:426 (-) Transcript_56238:1041-2318(-)